MHRTRIIRTNGTLSIEIPDDMASRMKLSEGEAIDLDDSQGDALIVWRKTHDDETSNVTQERADRIESIIQRRRAMLESLAQR